MGNFGSLVADLESAIHEGQQDKRVAILRQVTDLFVVGAGGFNEEHVDLFGDVLTRLIDQVESKVLAESERQAGAGTQRAERHRPTVRARR